MRVARPHIGQETLNAHVNVIELEDEVQEFETSQDAGTRQILSIQVDVSDVRLHRPSTLIDQKLRLRNFDARNERIETGAVVANRKGMKCSKRTRRMLSMDSKRAVFERRQMQCLARQ